MNAQDLEALRWKSRVVVIFAPAGSEDRLARQIQLFRASEAELRDRDVTQMVLRSSVENRKIADRFKLGQTGFTVVLIGKDGGGKFRSRDVVSAETLCRLIDSMPMRKEEMRERAGK